MICVVGLRRQTVFDERGVVLKEHIKRAVHLRNLEPQLAKSLFFLGHGLFGLRHGFGVAVVRIDRPFVFTLDPRLLQQLILCFVFEILNVLLDLHVHID